MSVIAENTADAPAARDSERVDEPVNVKLPGLIEERINANLETLNEQISTLSRPLNQLNEQLSTLTRLLNHFI